jgi:glutathione S-transferase
MSEYPVLYSFRRCPYAIRSRMALAAASIKCEMREVVLPDKPAEMLAISSKGTVPVLQFADGQVLDESMDIMYWALQQSDPEHWLDTNKDETQSLIEKNDFAFKDKLDRYKYFVSYPEYPQEYYRQQAEEYLVELEQRLKNNNEKGLIEERVRLADIAIFPFIRQFSRVDYDWFSNSAYTNLKQWLEKFEQASLFKSVMTKYKPWVTGGNTEYFL